MNNLATQAMPSVIRDGALRQALIIQGGEYLLVPEHLITGDMHRVNDEFEMAVHTDLGIVYVERIKGSWAIRQNHEVMGALDPSALKPIEFTVREKFSNAAYPFDHVDVRDPHPEVREFLRHAVKSNDDSVKELWLKAAAFIHCDQAHRVVIEFWSDDHADFMEYLNSGFEKWYSDKIEGMYERNIDILSYNEMMREKAKLIKLRSDGKLCDCCNSLLNSETK